MARTVRFVAAMTALVLIVVGCSTADPTSPSTESPGPSPTIAATAIIAATDEPSIAPPPTTPLATPSASADSNAPPALELITDGQRKPGVVGGYTWGTYTQSAPWHPSTGLAPISVPENGELSAELTGPTGIDSWAARVADAADPLALAVRPLGSGAGTVAFFPPPAGDWVLEIHVVYSGGAGDGAYYWRLVVP